MSTVVPTAPSQAPPFAWLWRLIREELAPYPARMTLVGRTSIATTAAKTTTMTVLLPEGAFGGVYALTISRESPRSTIADVGMAALAFVVAASYQLIGAIFFVSEPQLRFVWVAATFILMFYSLSALTNYTAAVR